jgi:hypothetical protein
MMIAVIVLKYLLWKVTTIIITTTTANNYHCRILVKKMNDDDCSDLFFNQIKLVKKREEKEKYKNQGSELIKKYKKVTFRKK